MKQVLIESTWHELVEQFQQCDRVYRVWYRVDDCVLIHDRLDAPHETREVKPEPTLPEGVTLWNSYKIACRSSDGAKVKIDGKPSGHVFGVTSRIEAEEFEDDSAVYPRTTCLDVFDMDALRAFRDRIRAERAGFTPAQVAEIERIARSVGVKS